MLKQSNFTDKRTDMAQKFDNSPLNNDEQVITNLLFEFAMSTDILVRRLEQIFMSRNRKLSHEYKHAFNNMIQGLKSVKYNYDKTFDQTISQQYEKFGTDAYDQISKDSNWIIRILMLTMDRAHKDPESLTKIEEFVKSLESSSYVPDEFVQSFKMR